MRSMCFLVPKHVLRKLIFSATEIQVFIFHPCLVRIPSKSSLRSWWRTSRWRIPVVKRWKRKPRFWFQNVESVAILWWKKLMKTEEFWGTSDSDKDFFHWFFVRAGRLCCAESRGPKHWIFLRIQLKMEKHTLGGSFNFPERIPGSWQFLVSNLCHVQPLVQQSWHFCCNLFYSSMRPVGHCLLVSLSLNWPWKLNVYDAYGYWVQ